MPATNPIPEGLADMSDDQTVNGIELKQITTSKGISTMTTKRIPLAVATVLIGTALGLSATLAQSNQPATSNAPASQQAPMSGQGMMGGGNMGNGDMMKMMGQMNRMMENCNRMMENMQHAPATPDRMSKQNG
jgi:hypothetical protein